MLLVNYTVGPHPYPGGGGGEGEGHVWASHRFTCSQCHVLLCKGRGCTCNGSPLREEKRTGKRHFLQIRWQTVLLCTLYTVQCALLEQVWWFSLYVTDDITKLYAT